MINVLIIGCEPEEALHTWKSINLLLKGVEKCRVTLVKESRSMMVKEKNNYSVPYLQIDYKKGDKQILKIIDRLEKGKVEMNVFLNSISLVQKKPNTAEAREAMEKGLL